MLERLFAPANYTLHVHTDHLHTCCLHSPAWVCAGPLLRGEPATFTPATFTPVTFTPATFTPATFTPATFTPATFTPVTSRLSLHTCLTLLDLFFFEEMLRNAQLDCLGVGRLCPCPESLAPLCACLEGLGHFARGRPVAGAKACSFLG